MRAWRRRNIFYEGKVIALQQWDIPFNIFIKAGVIFFLQHRFSPGIKYFQPDNASFIQQFKPGRIVLNGMCSYNGQSFQMKWYLNIFYRRYQDTQKYLPVAFNK